MSDGIAQDQLISFVRRIESEEDVKKAANEGLAEIYKEARGEGFDVKVLRKVIADRRKDSAERVEFETIYDLYWSAIHGVAHAHVENIEEFGDDVDNTDPIVDRSARRRHRFSESMEDAVELSAEAVADGLISPEAHAETVRLSSALANKFGDGPLHDATTGEILDHEIHGSSSINDEASSTAAPQGEAVHSQGTGAEMLAGREERSEGQAASADLPTLSPETATQSTKLDEAAPVGPCIDERGHEDGLRLKGNGTANIDSAAGIPCIGARESDAFAVDAFTQCGDDAPPLDPKLVDTLPGTRLKTTDEVADDMDLPAEVHPGCRKPKTCGRFSHEGLCAICRGEDRQAA